MGKIIEGLERAFGLKKFHEESLDSRGIKPVKGGAEKPPSVVELSEKDVMEAGNAVGKDYSGLLDESNEDNQENNNERKAA